MKNIKPLILLSATTLMGTVVPITSCSKKPDVVQHTITFSASDGITLSGETTIKVNDKTKWKDVTKPQASSSIEGYQIVGWYDSYTEITDETEITADLSAKCVGYDPKSILNEVTVVTAKKEYPNNTYIQGGTWGGFKQYYEVTDPEEEGSTFEGWYVDDKKIDDDYIFPIGQLTSTVTAHFVKDKRTITFDKTEGVTFDPETPDPVQVEDSTTWGEVEKPGVTVDTEHYYNIGWYIDGEGTQLEDTTPITKNITAKYYALKKSEISINVIIEIDSVKKTYVYYQKGMWSDFKAYYEIKDPVKPGYTFQGWYVNGTKIDESTYKFPEENSITIKAEFSINKYTVSFKTDDGATFEKQPDPIKVVYQTKWSAIEKPKVTLKPDHVADGWYDKNGGKMTDETPITSDTEVIYRTLDSKILDKIEVDVSSTAPIVFDEGDDFDRTGLAIKITSITGASKIITEGFTTNLDGKELLEFDKEVIVSYQGKTCKYNITVNPMSRKAYLELSTANESKIYWSSSLVEGNYLKYSLDGGGTWNDLPSGQDVTFGGTGNSKSICLKGKLINNEPSGYINHLQITSDNEASVIMSGSLMNLLLDDQGKPSKTFTDDKVFMNLFMNSTALKSIDESFGKLLPFKTLTKSCYYGLFSYCKALTNAPTLPANQLAIGCYNSMFNGCSSLKNAPALKATQLQDSCYKSMFFNCKSLITAPELNATQLYNECYRGMFSNCTSLKIASESGTSNVKIFTCPTWESSLTYPVSEMFNNCSGGSTPVAAGTTYYYVQQ